MKHITTEKAPAALGTYSQGVVTYALIHTSGQIGRDPGTNDIVKNEEAQIRQVFKNLKAICQAVGADFTDIVKLNVYLVDKKTWLLVNEVMQDLFTKPYPARTALGVAWLPFDAIVEIDAVVQKQN